MREKVQVTVEDKSREMECELVRNGDNYCFNFFALGQMGKAIMKVNCETQLPVLMSSSSSILMMTTEHNYVITFGSRSIAEQFYKVLRSSSMIQKDNDILSNLERAIDEKWPYPIGENF